MLFRSLRSLGLCAALALAASAAHAQTTPSTTAEMQPGQGRMGQGGMDMYKDLNLTADQKAKIETYMKENRPTRPSGPPTDADRQAMQARRTAMDAKMKEILTPEQYTKYQAMRPQRGQRPAPSGSSN